MSENRRGGDFLTHTVDHMTSDLMHFMSMVSGDTKLQN